MVSKHMAHLEKYLSARLLNRTTRRLSLTETGSIYFTHCQQILKDIEEAETEATQLTSALRGTLRLTAPLEFGVMYIAPLLADYLSLYPEVNLDFSLDDRTVDLVEEGFDLAIRIGTVVETGLNARKLATGGFAVCASPEYFRRHGVPRVPEDLAELSCLIYSYSSTGTEWHFTGSDGDHTVHVKGNLRSDSAELLKTTALGGAGFLIEPHFLVGPELRSGRLQAVLTEYKIRELGIYAVYPSRKYLSAKVRSFIDFLVKHFESNSDQGLW